MDGEIIKNIFESNYSDELMNIIRSNGNIDEFINQLETRQRNDFLNTNKTISAMKQSVITNKNDISQIDEKIASLQKEKSLASNLKSKIDEVTSIYPENRRAFVKKYLQAYFDNREIGPYVKQHLLDKPKGLIERLKSNKDIEKGNAKLAEFIEYCTNNNINSLAKNSSLLQDTIYGEDISYSLKKNEEEIIRLNNEKNHCSENIKDSERAIDRKIAEYDSIDPSNSKYAYSRQKQRNIINTFVAENKEYIINPKNITKEDILTKGLDEDYIFGQIMQSKYP